MTTQERIAARRLRRDVRMDKGYALLVMIMLTFALMIAMTSLSIRLDKIKDMQTDTLNQITDIRQEIDEIKALSQNTEKVSLVSPERLTEDERDLIERVVAAESRGEPPAGMVAVAQTIYDRSKLWELTPTEVVTAAGQYADPYTGEISGDVKKAVAEVFDMGIRAYEEPVTHFFSGAEPYWADAKVSRGTIGNHYFYGE